MMLRAGAQVPGPSFDLAAFQAEVASGNFHVYKTRAVTMIREVLQCGRDQALEFAKDAVLLLTPGDYAHTLKMPDGQLMDVYGKVIEGDGWYLKIEIHMNDGQPGIVSCHPAARDLTTRNGVVPATTRRFE